MMILIMAMIITGNNGKYLLGKELALVLHTATLSLSETHTHSYCQYLILYITYTKTVIHGFFTLTQIQFKVQEYVISTLPANILTQKCNTM